MDPANPADKTPIAKEYGIQRQPNKSNLTQKAVNQINNNSSNVSTTESSSTTSTRSTNDKEFAPTSKVKKSKLNFFKKASKTDKAEKKEKSESAKVAKKPKIKETELEKQDRLHIENLLKQWDNCDGSKDKDVATAKELILQLMYKSGSKPELVAKNLPDFIKDDKGKELLNKALTLMLEDLIGINMGTKATAWRGPLKYFIVLCAESGHQFDLNVRFMGNEIKTYDPAKKSKINGFPGELRAEMETNCPEEITDRLDAAEHKVMKEKSISEFTIKLQETKGKLFTVAEWKDALLPHLPVFLDDAPERINEWNQIIKNQIALGPKITFSVGGKEIELPKNLVECQSEGIMALLEYAPENSKPELVNTLHGINISDEAKEQFLECLKGFAPPNKAHSQELALLTDFYMVKLPSMKP